MKILRYLFLNYTIKLYITKKKHQKCAALIIDIKFKKNQAHYVLLYCNFVFNIKKYKVFLLIYCIGTLVLPSSKLNLLKY